MSRALTHFLEEAARRHLPRFEAWFPTSFDWERLCADVPEMAAQRARAGGSAGGPADRDLEDWELEKEAAAVFSASHLLGLAVLAAAFSEGEDPGELLARLTTVPDEDEEQRFDELVGTCLDAVEVRLSSADGEAPAPVEGGAAAAEANADRAETLTTLVWPAVREALAADGARVFDRAGEDADLLWSLARVAVVLAAFRWMAAEAHAADWPCPALGA